MRPVLKPVLKPALARTWRDTETLQFGAVHRHARVVERADTAVCSFLSLLDGTRERPALLAAGERLGLGRDPTGDLLDDLEKGGLLDDAAATWEALECYPQPRRELLGPDLASLSLVRPEPGAGPAALRGRAAARVEVRGAGRVGSAVAAALAAGGVGIVTVVDTGRVTPGDCSPAGLAPTEVGRLRATAARESVQRAAGFAPGGSRTAAAGRSAPPPTLVVLAPRSGSGAFAGGAYGARPLMRAGVPHLYTGVVEHLGVVGPLVLPGTSACGGCLAFARTEEDPAWPRLLPQLAEDGPGPARTPACDGALATAVAGLAALHVLLHLDGTGPPSVDGWCELSAADGMARRLRLRPHPDCGCQWQPGAPA
ncbi:ThiF family adenylyltransferase [Kitasatospora sp. NPDC050543]|uniref:ThiF family adenylyltransferase n=1 Tax=Kitasatospora sp. NPDC050543 TaxID=3364054 RepID=UPI0037962DB4